MHALGALNMQIAKERLVPAREREQRHWRGHTNIHADHAALDFACELAGISAAAGENRCAVAIRHAVEQRNCLIERAFGRSIESTGPNTSVEYSDMSGVTLSISVGPTKKPFDGTPCRPSRTSCAPSSTPRPIIIWMRSRASVSITGPISARGIRAGVIDCQLVDCADQRGRAVRRQSSQRPSAASQPYTVAQRYHRLRP